MKITKFTAVIAALVIVSGATYSIASADVSGDAGSDATQDVSIISNPATDAAQNSSANNVTSNPSTQSAQNSSANITSSPSNQPVQDSTAGIISSPSTDAAQDSTAGIVSSPSSDADQDGPVTAPVVPTTPGGGTVSGTVITQTSGGTSGSTSFGGGSSGSALSADVLSALSVSTATTSCPLITSYARIGSKNNSSDVAKLQAFLKDSQNLDVNVTGTFDQKTEEAVKAFQVKYLSDVMGPWGANQGSGMVYITTLKKINQLACNQPLTLSASEIAIINSYKQNIAAQAQSGAAVPATLDAAVGASDSSATSTVQVGMNDSQNSTVAAVGGASVLGRFWNFVANLFK